LIAVKALHDAPAHYGDTDANGGEDCELAQPGRVKKEGAGDASDSWRVS
jgi:hypothetical protein